MTPSTRIALATIMFAVASGAAQAQVAGSTTLGVSATRLEAIALGWSVKKQIIGQTVLNGAGEEVGRIDDLIVAPDSAVSFAVVGAGGFVGVRRHDVLIPVEQFKLRDDGSLLLEGATKAAIKALPPFVYAKP